MASNHITDEQLDRLSDEFRSMAGFTRRQLQQDDRQIDEELAHMLHEFAVDRALLARFADLVVRHDTPMSALAELLTRNAPVSA